MSKGPRKVKRWVESEYTLHCLPRSSELSDCSRPYNIPVILKPFSR